MGVLKLKHIHIAKHKASGPSTLSAPHRLTQTNHRTTRWATRRQELVHRPQMPTEFANTTQTNRSTATSAVSASTPRGYGQSTNLVRQLGVNGPTASSKATENANPTLDAA